MFYLNNEGILVYDPKNINMVRVSNYWQWAETQIVTRFMGLEINIIPLTQIQQDAIKFLLKTKQIL